LQPVVRLAGRFLGCDHLAQDAVQEALLSLSQQSPMPDRPIAWLMQAVVHRCRHLRRSLLRRRHHERAAAERCERHCDCDNPLHVAVAHDIGQMLTAARAALPCDQRVALDLYEHDGLSYLEIAHELGVPIGTVRSRLARARESLEAALAPEPARQARVR